MEAKQAPHNWSVVLVESRLPSFVALLDHSLRLPIISLKRLTTIKLWNNAQAEICVPSLGFSQKHRKSLKASLPLGDICKFLFGNYSSHTFIQFRNGQGEAVVEIHGLPHDTKTNTTSPFLTTLNFYQNAVANLCGFSLKRKPKLRISAATTQAEMQEVDDDRPTMETPLLRGSEDVVLRYMELVLRMGIEINAANLDYFLCNTKGHGLNCHSVTATLTASVVGQPIQGQDLNFAAPGISNNLKSHVPSLEGLQLDTKSRLNKIRASINRHLTDLGSRPVDWPQDQPSIRTLIVNTVRVLLGVDRLHAPEIVFQPTTRLAHVSAAAVPVAG